MAQKKSLSMFADAKKEPPATTYSADRILSLDPPTIGERMETVNKMLAYENTLKTVAQMRKLQRAFFNEKQKELKQGHLIESKRLEAAVDLRLGELGIKAE